ncbi:putative gamma-glutamyl hydrolase [Rosa chinensis]|uniref:folate gamma-glutamyl hydrolase n=1 Tax=Rosa chinensis TaxID=74649 RepID=A0A2P6QA06_ROSCH|nr:putative gamma-glutamyl hydrolase [Rosa chinensis]
MPSPFLAKPTSIPPPNSAESSSSSDAPNDAVPASSSSSRCSEMWNYLWIPFLISLSKELTSAKAQSTPTILLPTQLAGSDSSQRCTALDPKLNYRPVIGILSHPGDGASGRLSNATGTSYIAASYVKFVESAGARVIPLIYNEPSDVLFQKLNLVNGMLFTGGWAKSGRYYEVAAKIFKMILKKNDAGDHFPLYAICLGFELLTMIISKVYVSTVHAYHYPVTAFQWHLEKNAFEWGLPMIPHSEDAIHVTQHIANFFISEARKSLNRPPIQDVLDNLIYNYSPTFCGKAGKGYDEVYIFKQPSLAHL